MKIRTSLATAALLVGALLAFPAVASAHTGLESSTPADGAVLEAAPTEIVLEFAEELLDDAETISINTAEGTNVSSVKVQPEGNQVSAPWPADLPAGEYQVAYRVVSADGHPVSGAINFTITAAASSSAAASAVASAAPAVSAAPAASAEPSGSAVPISETAEPESTSGSPWLGLGIGVVIGLVLVVLFAAMRRKRG